MGTRKAVWPEVGRGFWIAAALSAGIAITCLVNSLFWAGRTFPGFFLWENLFVPTVGDTDWTGYEAGVPYPSRLVAMNDQAVSAASDVYRAAGKVPLGTEVRYTFELEDGESQVEVDIPTMRISIADYLWTLGTYILTGVLLTLLGFSVYLIRPDAPAARAMLIAGTTWGLYLVTSADIVGPAWFRPLCLTLESIGPVALVHLALSFPVERQILVRHPRLLVGLYVMAALAGVARNVFFTESFQWMLAFNHFHGWAVIAGGSILVILLAQSYVFPPSAGARQRTKIAVLGGFFAFLSPVAGYLLFNLMGVSIPFNFLAMPLAVFPVAIGYAIVKYDLFEVDAIIRQAVAWSLLTGLIAVLYVGGVGTLEVLFAGRSGRVAQLFFLLTIVAVFNPLRNRVQAAVDFLFARDHYDYRRTVAEASQALAALLDLETVVARILHTITATIHVDFGAVWLRRDGDSYRLHAVAGSRDAAGLPARLHGDSALVARLEKRPQRILSENELGAKDGPVAEELTRLGARLLVPLSFERRLVGFVALGQKQSGRFYSGEDMELLRTLANQGAVAVENAHSYRALIRANEELRAAQSRLIEAERFAAIGELSASVAHSIRNPLAGIKVAAQLAGTELPPEHPLHENVTDIVSEVDKLESRIKALLDFAKPFEPRPTRCQVAQIISDAVTSLRSQIVAQGIVLWTDIDAGLPTAFMDYAQIEQVVLALLSNAVEAMPDGGQLVVRARLGDSGRHIVIEVSDSGPGISPELHSRLFKLFFTTKPSGTGLGLAIAKKIVELHGGTISARSQVASGSQFMVELPLAQPIPSRLIA